LKFVFIITAFPKHGASALTRKGEMEIMLPLGLLSPGELGEIIAFRTGNGSSQSNCRCGEAGGKNGFRLEDMGLRIGKTVEMLSGSGGPVLLRVNESRIAIGRGLAMKIMVRKSEGGK